MPYVFEDFVHQGDLPATLTEEDVVSVRLMEDDVSADIPLFLRSHLMKQELEFQKFLSDKSKKEFYVSGPPGCGKTAYMTLAAHRYAENETKRVLMVNYRDTDTSACYIFKIDGSKTRKLRKALTRTNIVKVVEELLEEDGAPFNLCIFDGVRYNVEQCSDLLSVLNSNTGKGRKIEKVAHVASLEFHIPTGDKQQGIRSRMKRSSFDSFTKDDYLLAFANKEFLRRVSNELLGDILQWQKERERMLEHESTGTDEMKDVSDTDEMKDIGMDEAMDSSMAESGAVDNAVVAVEALDENVVEEYAIYNFFYAGGSARFMFEYTIEQIKVKLKELIGQVRFNEWESFTRPSLASSASNAVNSLMQQFSGQCIAVSRYILFEAYEHVEGQLIGAVEAVANAMETAP